MLLRQVSVPKALIECGISQFLAQQLLMVIYMNTAICNSMQKQLGCAQDSVQVFCAMFACRIRRVCPSGQRSRVHGNGGIPCMVCGSTEQAAQQASHQQVRPYWARTDIHHQQQAC